MKKGEYTFVVSIEDGEMTYDNLPSPCTKLVARIEEYRFHINEKEEDPTFDEKLKWATEYLPEYRIVMCTKSTSKNPSCEKRIVTIIKN